MNQLKIILDNYKNGVYSLKGMIKDIESKGMTYIGYSCCYGRTRLLAKFNNETIEVNDYE